MINKMTELLRWLYHYFKYIRHDDYVDLNKVGK